MELLETPINNNSINNLNPATGDLIATIPKSDLNDIDLAVNAAKKHSLYGQILQLMNVLIG